MTVKKTQNVQSFTFALIVIVLSTLISIGYLQFRINTYTRKYIGQLPQNGTELWHPSPTATPIPKIIVPGKYSNEELGIALTLPKNSESIETTQPDDWLKLTIRSLTNKNLVMNISRSKKIIGYGGQGTFSCEDILIDGKLLIIDEQHIRRCKLSEKDTASYDVRILYKNSSDPLVIRVYYSFIHPPTPQEFTFFDNILSTMDITK